MKAYTATNGSVISSAAVTAVDLLMPYENKYQVVIFVGPKSYDFYTSSDQTKAQTVLDNIITDLGWTASDATAFGG